MARSARVVLTLAGWYTWLIFGTQLMDRQSLRLCLDYGVCGDVQLYGILMAAPLLLLALWVAARADG